MTGFTDFTIGVTTPHYGIDVTLPENKLVTAFWDTGAVNCIISEQLA